MSDPQTTPLFGLRGLAKTFTSGSLGRRRSVHAVREVSLDIAAGEAVGLVGESGSGKSTVARLAVRLIEPTAGQILLDGRNVLAEERRQASRGYRHRVQMIFQDPFASLNPVHTVGHHLGRVLRVHDTGGDITAATGELLDTVGLASLPGIAGRYPHELSGGQRQRVAIARALAADPDVVIADEPTSMLDVSVRVGVLNLLRDLRTSRRLGMLLITHDLASAHYSTSRVNVMYAGYLVESGPSQQLISQPHHPYTRLLVSAVPRRSRTGQAPPVAPPPNRGPATAAGCPFAPRCPQRLAICDQLMPGPTTFSSHSWVRCHQYGPGTEPSTDPVTRTTRSS